MDSCFSGITDQVYYHSSQIVIPYRIKLKGDGLRNDKFEQTFIRFILLYFYFQHYDYFPIIPSHQLNKPQGC